MNRNKALLLFLLLASFCLAPVAALQPFAPSTAVAAAAPPLALLSLPTLFRRIRQSFRSKSLLTAYSHSNDRHGANLYPHPALVVDLMRLQSDTAFLGTLTNVPSGSYTVQLSLSSPEITFLNDTSSTITANGATCRSAQVCTATLSAVGTPTISSFTFNATTSGLQGIEIDFK